MADYPTHKHFISYLTENIVRLCYRDRPRLTACWETLAIYYETFRNTWTLVGRNAELVNVAAVRGCNCHWALKGCSVNCEEEEEED
jgi:hypothetical protein